MFNDSFKSELPLQQIGTGASPPLPVSQGIGHVYLDPRGSRLHCLNATARRLHDEGIPFTTLNPAGPPPRTLAGEEVKAADLPLLRAWRERRPCELVFLLPRAGGANVQVTWSAAPLLDAAQQVVGVVGTVHCAPSEIDWQAMAGLAHDLRTPLNAIGFLLSALDRRSLNEEQRRGVLDGMRSSAERALRIGMELLEWCRGPVQKRADPARSWFALKPFLYNLAQEQTGLAERKGLTLTTDLHAIMGWEMFTDRIRLGRLLSNLLVNAVRYTPAGRIEFTASWREEQGERWLALGVVDTGSGISPEEQESIFQPFERGRAGRESDSGGSGLGLAVVDRLVDELGLKLEVYSEYGRGSAFHLLMPAPMLRQEATAPAPAGKG